MPKTYWFNKHEVLTKMRNLENIMRSVGKTGYYELMLIMVWLYEIIIQNIMCKYYKFNDNKSHSDENVALTTYVILEVLRTQENDRQRRLDIKYLINCLVTYRTLRNHIAHFSIYDKDIALQLLSMQVSVILRDILPLALKLNRNVSLNDRNSFISSFKLMVTNCMYELLSEEDKKIFVN